MTITQELYQTMKYAIDVVDYEQAFFPLRVRAKKEHANKRENLLQRENVTRVW